LTAPHVPATFDPLVSSADRFHFDSLDRVSPTFRNSQSRVLSFPPRRMPLPGCRKRLTIEDTPSHFFGKRVWHRLLRLLEDSRTRSRSKHAHPDASWDPAPFCASSGEFTAAPSNTPIPATTAQATIQSCFFISTPPITRDRFILGKHAQQSLAMPPLLGTIAQHHLFPDARLA